MKVGRRSIKLRRVIIFVIFFITYLTIVCVVGPDKTYPTISKDHPIFHSRNVTVFKIENNVKLILIWTRIQGGFHNWGLFPGSFDLLSTSCPNSNCVLTFDKKYLEDCDAVIFSWYDLKGYLALGKIFSFLVETLTFGQIDIFSNDGLPLRKKYGQKYILFWMEPPNILEKYVRFFSDISKPLDNQIDWTVSYRRDSTFYHPYCYSVPKSSQFSHLLENNVLAKFSASSKQTPLSNIFPWPASIYNLNETDYFTEKLCNILEYNIVPIVLGGAEYSIAAPPNSVINVKDFKSVPDLADYLRYLVANPDAYKSYFSWKSDYKIEFDVQKVFTCDLCKMLNEKNPVKSVSSFSSWFHSKKCKNSWRDFFN